MEELASPFVPSLLNSSFSLYIGVVSECVKLLVSTGLCVGWLCELCPMKSLMSFCILEG